MAGSEDFFRGSDFEFLFNTVQMFVDQQDFFNMLDKDGTACSAHLECIAICVVEIQLFQNAQISPKSAI